MTLIPSNQHPQVRDDVAGILQALVHKRISEQFLLPKTWAHDYR